MHTQLTFKRLAPGAKVPQYMTAGAACFDLHACLDENTRGTNGPGHTGRQA
jgi:dUTPase